MKKTDVMIETAKLVEGSKRELSGFEKSVMKLLLRGDLSMADICTKLKVGRGKLWLCTRDEFFKQELRSNQETIFNAALASLVGEARDMARTLVSIALNPEETSSVRIQAVKLAYASVLNMGSQFEFRERLSKIESQLNDM